MLEGKNIRTLSNGMDNFDDYWTDSSKIMDTSSSFYVLSFHVILNKTIRTGYSHLEGILFHRITIYNRRDNPTEKLLALSAKPTPLIALS